MLARSGLKGTESVIAAKTVLRKKGASTKNATAIPPRHQADYVRWIFAARVVLVVSGLGLIDGLDNSGVELTCQNSAL